MSSLLDITAGNEDEQMHQDWIRLNDVSRGGGSHPLRNHQCELPRCQDNVAPYLFPCLAFSMGFVLNLRIFWSLGLDPQAIFAAFLADGMLYGIVVLAKRPVHDLGVTSRQLQPGRTKPDNRLQKDQSPNPIDEWCEMAAISLRILGLTPVQWFFLLSGSAVTFRLLRHHGLDPLGIIVVLFIDYIFYELATINFVDRAHNKPENGQLERPRSTLEKGLEKDERLYDEIRLPGANGNYSQKDVSPRLAQYREFWWV